MTADVHSLMTRHHEQWLALVEQRTEAFWSSHPIALFHQVGDLVPVELDIKPGADPPMVANVGRYEEPFGVGGYQHALGARRGLTPHRWAAVNAVLHSEDLIPHLE